MDIDTVGAPRSASDRVAGQAVWSVAAKLATLAGTLGASVIAARLLGAHEFGVWSLARNMVAVAALAASFCLDRALLRFVPELDSQGSRHGTARLLGTVLLTQGAMLAITAALLLAARPLWQRLFTPEIGPLLPLVCVLTAVLVLKETLYQLFFALEQAKALGIATTVTGFLWLGLTFVLLHRGSGAFGALAAQAAAIAVGVVYLLPALRRVIARVGDRSRAVIANHRLVKFAASLLGSGVVNLIVQRQSEVYFLATVVPASVVGFYDLGYSLPQLGMELLPLSLYAVVLSAVTVSYHRDPSRLGHLVGWYYKLLAVVTVPVSLLGVAWADKLLVLLYGQEMAPAGTLARIFSVVHLLPFVSLPIGVALNVVEKAHRTIAFGIAQAAVAVTLDLLLIPRFHVAGAVTAVVLSFFLVTPLTIRYALRFTGPIEFPVRWIVRLVLVLSPGLLPALARPYVSGWAGVVAGVAASLALMVAGLRFGGLIGVEERYRLERAPIPARRLVLRLLLR